jgi:hypothetical protein
MIGHHYVLFYSHLLSTWDSVSLALYPHNVNKFVLIVSNFYVAKVLSQHHCFMQGTMGHAPVILPDTACTATLYLHQSIFFNTPPHTKKYIRFNRPPYVVHFQYNTVQYCTTSTVDSSTTPDTGSSQKPPPPPSQRLHGLTVTTGRNRVPNTNK